MTQNPFPSDHSVRSGRARLKRALGVLAIILLGALGLVLVLGLLPLPSRGMRSIADPARSYEDALARFAEIAQAEPGVVNDLGHSRLLVHGEIKPGDPVVGYLGQRMGAYAET